MALAYQSDSTAFADDQRPVFKVDYWDTPFTVPSAGIEFELWDLLDPNTFEATAGIEAQSVSRANMNSLLGNASIVKDVLGGGAGRVPMVYDYWGAGALPGVAKPKRQVIRYSGNIKTTGPATLIFSGRGRVVVYNNGASTPIGWGEMREPVVGATLYNQTEFEDLGGYVVVSNTFTAGQELEIIYWHNDDDWGGVACKVIPGSWSYNAATIKEQLRDAAPLSASYFGVEAAGGSLSSSELPYVEEVTVSRSKDSITTATIKVPLAVDGDPNGYYWDATQNALVDNDSGLVVKEDRLVQISAGYADPSAIKDANGDITAETYSRLYGHIVGIEFQDQLKTAVINCADFGQKMMMELDENYPDRLSYHANAYIRREGASEPVWGIEAFDNWPLETAVAEYCYRAGIDPVNIGKSATDTDPNAGRSTAYTETHQDLRYLRKLFAARKLGNTDKKILLERNTAYGNVGILKKDYLPNDDTYLYPPELTSRLYDQASKLCDHYGYNFLFNANGQAVIKAGTNPDVFVLGNVTEDAGDPATINSNLSVSDTGLTFPADRSTAPSAVGGLYVDKLTSEGAWTIVVEGYFARLDLYLGIGDDGTYNAADIDIAVQVRNSGDTGWTPASGLDTTLEPYYNGDLAFFYDGVLREDGTNACLFTAMASSFDRYQVTISNGGVNSQDGNGTARHRINGIAAYYHDPEGNALPVALATNTNVFSMEPKSARGDLRNQIIVVGARKATVTDSAKLSIETNPNNPDLEFNIAVAADVGSIYDSGATNYVGARRVGVIYDDKVSSTDFANWLALTALFRYRQPIAQVPIETIAIPQLETGDPVLAYEAKQSSVNRIVWVDSFQESWSATEATTSIETSSFPDIPSYQPREDIDIDTYFDGHAAVNVALSYDNIYGDPVGNSILSNPDIFEAPTSTQALSLASTALSNPAMPETIRLVGVGTPASEKYDRTLVNTPYNFYWYISSWSSNNPTLTIDLQEGDGDSDVYSTTYYEMNNLGDYTYTWHYRYFGTRTGGSTNNPFYDPYTSELGHLVSVKFDALITGRYRVSIWDATKSGGRETPVAWLTNPEADGTEPEAHWQYLEPGSDVEYLWDGVDNIGYWNRLQSKGYAERIAGSFGEEPLAVGTGFYAWNDQSTSLMTQIGDEDVDNYWGTGYDIRQNNYPMFTVGRFGKFYVKIEVWNDALYIEDRDQKVEEEYRTVRTRDMDTTHNSVAQAHIYTHLGEPTQVDVSIDEWNTASGEYTVGTQTAGFTDTDTSLRNGKPVRLTFVPRPRPGVLFEEDPNYSSVKLTRMVHLKATIFDQFWTFYNTNWDNIDSRNQAYLENRLTSRMYHNDDHTVQFQDTGFRRGEQINGFEWIFQPKDFRKDFGAGYEEELTYGDYEQLEALPGYSSRLVGGSAKDSEAYLTVAFMNYLFYFSAHTLDRSGRRQWCLNREFRDESKIVSSAWTGTAQDRYKVDHELKGADQYIKRTIFVREWLDTDWKSSSPTRTLLTPAATTHTGTGGLDTNEDDWVQFLITEMDPLNTSTLDMPASAAYLDDWLVNYQLNASTLNEDIRRYDGSTNRTFPTGGPTYIRPAAFGNWDFQRGPQTFEWYSISPRIDFHPYWVKTMPNWHIRYTNNYTTQDSADADEQAKVQHAFAIPEGQAVYKFRDEKAQDVWFGYAFNPNISDSQKEGAVVGQSIRGWLADKSSTDLQFAFDYARQDMLDRFDQFRGVRSRGPVEDRDEGTNLGYWVNNKQRYGPTQPVKPSGVYLINLARYDEYITAKPTNWSKYDLKQHFSNVSDWYDLRFRSEYVWYNDKHFPVNQLGGTMYNYFRHEYTESLEDDVFFAGTQYAIIYYDPGAWTGWKDDITSAAWTTTPKLRWRENWKSFVKIIWSEVGNEYTHSIVVRSSAGLSAAQPWLDGGEEAPGTAAVQRDFMGEERYYKKSNIFDTATQGVLVQRLAVGPEVPESQEISLNLVLPPRLKDRPI